MSHIIESDSFVIVKVPQGEWSLIEVKAGTHFATIHSHEHFDTKELADEEMRKKYPKWGTKEEKAPEIIVESPLLVKVSNADEELRKTKDGPLKIKIRDLFLKKLAEKI
jgi:hypothetical protein